MVLLLCCAAHRVGERERLSEGTKPEDAFELVHAVVDDLPVRQVCLHLSEFFGRGEG